MHPSVKAALAQIASGANRADELEGHTLEFKTEKASLKETAQDLVEAALCFANSNGGTVVVGISDTERGPGAFIGSATDPSVLRTKIYELTEPPLTVEVEPVTFAEASLLVITVTEGVAVHTTKKGVATRRQESSCLPMRPDAIARLAEERRGLDWSESSSGRSVADVDSRAESVLRSYLSTASREEQRKLASLELPAVLAELGLLLSHPLKLNHAGALLLCRPPTRESHEVLVYQHRQTLAGEADVVRRWQAPILVAFRECLEAIEARVVSTPITTRAGQQLTLQDFSMDAVREALANALIHGDLRDKRPVTIEHSPESLRITSPGPLVSGITPQNILTHGSKPRFRALARAMRIVGLAEELGQGVDRMFREAVKSGQATPRVEVTDGATPETVVEFKAGPPNTRLAKFVAELPPHEQNDTDALLIAYALCSHRSVSATEISPIIQRSVEDSQTVLHRLATGEAKLVEPTGGTASRRLPRYRFTGPVLATLGSAVTYSRTSRTDSDRKVIEHVREYETINNATVQRLFDIDVYKARDLIQELVGREILVRVSTQTRGTSVKYGPGPRFPQRSRRKRKATLAPQLPFEAE